MTVKENLSWAKGELKRGEVAEPEASAELLMMDVLGYDRPNLYANQAQHLCAAAQRCYKRYIKRRLRHEPVWQIIGKAEFWGIPFFVNKDVLVPRPETEFLVEETIRYIKNKKLEIKMTNNNAKILIADIGTGSGAIAIALAIEIKNQKSTLGSARVKKIKTCGECSRTMINKNVKFITATDISGEALKVAKKNAKANGVANMIQFIHADIFSPITNDQRPMTKYDLIIANLPYIPHEDIDGLSMDIHHYEPRIALDGGKGGLEIYERFLKKLPKHLNPSGVAICEIGKDQGKNFYRLVKKYLGSCSCEIRQDLAQIDRIAIIKKER